MSTLVRSASPAVPSSDRPSIPSHSHSDNILPSPPEKEKKWDDVRAGTLTDPLLPPLPTGTGHYSSRGSRTSWHSSRWSRRASSWRSTAWRASRTRTRTMRLRCSTASPPRRRSRRCSRRSTAGCRSRVRFRPGAYCYCLMSLVPRTLLSSSSRVRCAAGAPFVPFRSSCAFLFVLLAATSPQLLLTPCSGFAVFCVYSIP